MGHKDRKTGQEQNKRAGKLDCFMPEDIKPQHHYYVKAKKEEKEDKKKKKKTGDMEKEEGEV